MVRKAQPLELRRMVNVSCQEYLKRGNWDDLEKEGFPTIKAALDGLPVRCVGEWAEDKIYRLSQYFGIFAQGMHIRWRGLNYIEICSGPGRCVIKGSIEEIDGTSLAILNHKNIGRLCTALFIDVDKTAVDALNKRIQALNVSSKAKAVMGDYRDSDQIASLLKTLPANCLNLVFIDPTHCEVPFETVEAIVQVMENVDLIVNVSMGTDINRNLARAILESGWGKTRKKYELFLGDENFFNREDVINVAKNEEPEKLRRLFSEFYKTKLAALGFVHSDWRPIKHYYYLLFASRARKGLEFWLKACTYSPDGQKELNFLGEG